tara:strand:+ start:387 stop:1061 length:675 start_codon:yes stop_codon:yes gene_type:complete
MIERTSREYVLELLKKNQNNWNILDIGCNQDAVEYAKTAADIQNFSKFYKNKKFVLVKTKELPFKDNEFDFVYASHVIEHIDDVEFFIKEIKRISKKGYIELPSLLEDNIVLSDNSVNDHKWIFKFDDVNHILLAEKKKQLIEPFITHGILFSSLRKNFRSSLVLELLWEDDINFQFKDFTNLSEKPYFISIVKKYLSYKIRNNKKISISLFILFILILFNFWI